MPRLLHSIRRNSSAFLASLDTTTPTSPGLSGDRFKEDSKEYSSDGIEYELNQLTTKGSESFLTDLDLFELSCLEKLERPMNSV